MLFLAGTRPNGDFLLECFLGDGNESRLRSASERNLDSQFVKVGAGTEGVWQSMHAWASMRSLVFADTLGNPRCLR